MSAQASIAAQREEVSVSADGIRSTLTLLVEGLDGPPSARAYQATQTAGVPRYFDAHPAIPGARALNIRTSMIDGSPSKATVTVDYARPGPGAVASADQEVNVEVGVTLISKTVTHDKDGKQLTVEYTLPNIVGQIVAGIERKEFVDAQQPGIFREYPPGKTLKQIKEVSVLVPQRYLRMVRIEESSPDDKSREFVGKVNSAEFYKGKERSWLCTKISGDYLGVRDCYRVTYEFLAAPDDEGTWDAQLTFTDPQTGAVLPETDAAPNGNGRAAFEVYRTADFAQLKLIKRDNSPFKQ